MKMSTTNKFDFVSYKTGLVPILHKDNGCWAIQQINGMHEEEVAKATPVNRHARNINEELHTSCLKCIHGLRTY